MFFTCLKTGRARLVYDYFTDAGLKTKNAADITIHTGQKNIAGKSGIE
jgi:hypothetical protein